VGPIWTAASEKYSNWHGLTSQYICGLNATFVRNTVNNAEVGSFSLKNKQKIADQLFTFRFNFVVNKMSTVRQLTCRTTLFLVRESYKFDV
jgi:hypothetical protein